MKKYLLLSLLVTACAARAADSESTPEIDRLLKAIEARKGSHAVMPGTNKASLEDQLVVELAKEVIRLKEENRKLSIKIDELKKK